MKTERFRLALREMKSSDWERFETLGSTFLASEFPTLRTLASFSGDSGRDGTLFAPAGNEVAIQYSVSRDWKQKIRRTIQRVHEKFSGIVHVLVYVSNQQIGPKADDLKYELQQDHRVHLDVRDEKWFVERVNSDDARQEAAEELARVIADPFLAGDDVVRRKSQALSDADARAGLLYLTLQWEDTTREKGLTRLSYEALTRAALRGTDSEHRVTRQQISDRVARILPTQDRSVVDRYVDSALERMAKKIVRHWPKYDEYCITFDEQQRIRGRLAELELQDREFESAIQDAVGRIAEDLGVSLGDSVVKLVTRIKCILDRFILNSGESFASAVISGNLARLERQALNNFVIEDVAGKGNAGMGGKIVDLLTNTVEWLVQATDPTVQACLRRSADAYTLLAFLRAVPDVQRVVAKLFSHGRVWLDTSIVLPAMAETLVRGGQRRFSSLLRIATDAGLELRVTPGVVEEVERHLHRSLVCQRTHELWKGRIPFMLSVYAASGEALGDYPRWVEQFAGRIRPEDDIAEYLNEIFGVEIETLEAEAGRASEELRWAVQEIWQVAHERRRGEELDQVTLSRLAAHDVENYVGVIMRRRNERESPFGYTSWWLTLDPTAFAARGVLKERLGARIPDSPVLSPDFLANYLAVGPIRHQVRMEAEGNMPILLDLGVQELPADLLTVAGSVRQEASGLSERVIRRKVRDGVDRAKRRMGPIAQEGVAGMEATIRKELASRQKG